MTNRSPSPAVAVARGQVAALSRSRTADDPDLVAARQRLKAAGLYEYVQRVVESAPPLTDGQKERVIALLSPTVGGSR